MKKQTCTTTTNNNNDDNMISPQVLSRSLMAHPTVHARPDPPQHRRLADHATSVHSRTLRRVTVEMAWHYPKGIMDSLDASCILFDDDRMVDIVDHRGHHGAKYGCKTGPYSEAASARGETIRGSQIKSCHVMSCHAIVQHILSRYTALCYIVLCYITACHTALDYLFLYIYIYIYLITTSRLREAHRRRHEQRDPPREAADAAPPGSRAQEYHDIL